MKWKFFNNIPQMTVSKQQGMVNGMPDRGDYSSLSGTSLTTILQFNIVFGILLKNYSK